MIVKASVLVPAVVPKVRIVLVEPTVFVPVVAPIQTNSNTSATLIKLYL